MDQHVLTRRRVARLWRQPAFLIVSTLFAATAHAAPHFVTFINDSARTVTFIDSAPSGTSHWHSLNLGGPLIGGRNGEAAVRFDAAGACKQDLLVTYRGMAPLTIMGFDVCRSDRLYLGKALARALRPTSTRRSI